MSSKSFFSDVVKIDKQRMSDDGDDSPPRPKRKIKRVVVLSSSSESENDENVGVAISQRKKLRIISDEEDENESSGSSVICAGTRRRRMLPRLRDSGAESDSTGWATDCSGLAKPTASTSKTTSGFTSDSSEGNSDKCSICLLRFTNQEVGTPESCEHIFCLDCIIEWSKNVNTCPVDRMMFNSIVVKACAGGRVLRTQPVKVVERRPSVDLFVVEDPTPCEICGSTDGEETMLLCDSCDLGYHMQCLTPPLSEVPPDQWLCPNCYINIVANNSVLQDINLSEVEDLLDDILDTSQPLGPRPSALRQTRNVRRSSRNLNISDQPSTSSGQRRNNAILNEVPTTSRGSRSAQGNTSHPTTRRRTTKRRKYKRRRAKTVVIEYEVQDNGKFPVTKKITRKVKKRRVKKRQPRTAARRSHVRASVRARLATLKTHQAQKNSLSSDVGVGGQTLSVRKQRAGILPLTLFSNANELDYFSDGDDAISEEASTAVAVRPTANILSTYRQARRKMIMVPSPPHASSAPDILSNILESQTLLHSKHSVISIAVDGNVNVKLRTENRKSDATDTKDEAKIDLSKANAAVRKAPSYPGQNRGGGWGGGYRGNYHREQSNNFNRGGNYESGYSGSYQNRQGNSYNYQNNNNMRSEDTEYFDNFPRRPQPYSNDETYFDRSRRPSSESNRGMGTIFSNHQRTNDQNASRYSLGPSWQPYNSGGAPAPRQDAPPGQARHSFGGFENPVDMRMGQMPPMTTNIDTFSGVEAPRQEKTQPQAYQSLPEPQAYQPLSEPPVFNFPKISEVEKSEDEKSDSGLVIDTEKYDPTEPTHDDDSGEEETAASTASATGSVEVPLPVDATPFPAVQSILAGIDTSAMNVPSNILDTAVRQVLQEHRNLIVPSSVESRNDRSDDESDGDCPNFSIYSAASVHIANNSSSLAEEVPKEQTVDSLEDLVQEDDDTPSNSPTVQCSEVKAGSEKPVTKAHYVNSEYDEKRRSEEEYKEKVSKRCPITTNKRNPIKIKLNTPSLIKRQVSLYDEEENSQDAESSEKTEPVPDTDENKSIVENKTPKNDTIQKTQTCVKLLDTFKKCDENAKIVNATKQSFKGSKSDDDSNCKEISQHQTDENVARPSEDNISETIKNGDDKEVDCSISGNDNKIDDDDQDNIDNVSEQELSLNLQSPKTDRDPEKVDDNVEKMTESISETEDERSYTPCLDENKSNKDASFEAEKDKGLEGLDTEMISEEEGNEMFSENERAPSESFCATGGAAPAGADGEIPDKKKEGKKSNDGGKKKKKKESKKEGKEKTKSKKKAEISFKKLSKSGKERNYRERDKDDKKTDRERRDSGDAAESRQRRRKEKRKDLERYDVRTVVTEKRKKQKDPFGRDVSPRGHSPSLSPPQRSPSRGRSQSRGRSPSRGRRSLSRGRPSPSRVRRSLSRVRRSLSAFRRSPSRARRSLSRGRRSASGARRSPSPPRRSPSRGRRSLSRNRRSPPARESPPRRGSPARSRSPSMSRPRRSPVRTRRSVSAPRRRSGTPQTSPRRRGAPRRKRRRSVSRLQRSPPRRALKKKKRIRPERREPPPTPERKRKRSASRVAAPAPPSPASRPPSPRTPPPEAAPETAPRERRRRDPERPRRRGRDLVGPSKEVFTSGDNILVSVSFKEQERGEEGERRRRRETRRERRRRRRTAVAPDEGVKPVAIIDLERSPFRELTPSPKNVIVLSDSEPGEREGGETAVAPVAPEPPAETTAPALGPKTPPEPAETAPAEASPEPAPADGASAAPSPDAYDPFEPTRSPSASPGGCEAASPAGARDTGTASPPRTLMTLEAAQRSNLSADDVLARRPLTPVEKVMALLQSTREAEAAGETEPPPAPRIVLPSPTRGAPKLFPGKPSPIKSNPVKPMQALRLPRAPSEGGASPYSPGSSDFGELFEPPTRRGRALPSVAYAAPRPGRVPVRLDRKRGKTQVGVKIDDDNLKILDELPSSAVELQVKSKFLKKLNRQERVVEEVKLVLKPHYNKKRVTKDEYKDILRRAVPKICHNKSGEINPTKIQTLVEAYVKKFRKKHKLGVA